MNHIISRISVFISIILISQISFGQNVAITDDDAYNAHSSAMLDVKSITKGMLVPRLTTAQRTAISSPATGLLVFDTDEGDFYFFNGGWVNLTSDNPGDLWTLSGSNVYLTDTDHNLGIGSTTPVGKLEVKGDAISGIDEPLFAVINNTGDTVFAVYPEGVRIYVDDNGAKASGNRGGFAVGGFSSGKGLTNEYLRITPDSVRIYIDDEFSKASKGGFAVGGFSSGKGNTDDYLFVKREQSRIYVDGDGGFSVGDISTGSSVDYLDLTPDNYFIGHESGTSMTTGLYNSFFGYETGMSSTQGDRNIFIGYQSGYSSDVQDDNIFIGYKSGYSTTFTAGADNNVFIGSESGYNNISGSLNTFLGFRTGYNNTSASSSVYIGNEAGYTNSTGSANTFIGYKSGNKATQNGNTFAGYCSGWLLTTGTYNAFYGSQSASQQTSGSYNAYFGANSGYYNAIGQYNAIFGYQAGRGVFNNSYNYNSLFGYQAGYGNTTGDRNTFIGARTGYSNTTGDYNTCLGYRSGYSNATGTGNVFLGYYAGYSETGSAKLYIDNSSTADPLIWGDFGLNRIVINGNAGDNPNSRTFYANGTAGGDYAWYNDSDRKLKKNITTISSPLEKVKQLRGVNFEWKDPESMEKGVRMGFIAQEAINVIPEVVDKSGDYFTMQYAPVTALLVEGMKEQQRIIELQQNEIKELKEELNNIKSLLETSAKK